MNIQLDYKSFWIEIDNNGKAKKHIIQRSTNDLPKHPVLIKVKYSGLNYKDYLSCQGHKGITRLYPHQPGIDAAGEVVSDNSGKFMSGDQVLVTGYDLGMNTSGGFGQYIKVPAEWVVPIPSAFNLKDAMTVGTAGYTAALALYKMEKMEQHPEKGPILVTGSTGGVGSLAIAILSRAGYEVWASTGKVEKHEYLKSLGASKILSREEIDDRSGKPLIQSKWAGAIDNVGGNTLATCIKACKMYGSVCVIGNVSSVELNTTVFPFLLNGVNVLGVASADTPMPTRLKIWEKLASSWYPGKLELIRKEIKLQFLEDELIKMGKGQSEGRVVIDLW